MKEIAEKVRAYALGLVEAARIPGAFNAVTADRDLVNVLALAWSDAARAEWENYIAAAPPELKRYARLGRKVMLAQGYTPEDPICATPNQEMPYADVYGKKVVCIQYGLGMATPLSAIFTAKVIEVLRHAGETDTAPATVVEPAAGSDSGAPSEGEAPPTGGGP